MPNQLPNTEKRICNAMLDLLETMPFSSVKVADIVKCAKVGRSTFYTHFDSVYAVMQKIEDDYMEVIGTEQAAELARAVSVRDEHAEASLRAWATFAKGNLRVFRLLCGPNGDPGFEARIFNLGMRTSTQLQKRLKSPNARAVQNLFNAYNLSGLVSMTKWWASHEEDYDVETVVQFCLRLLNTIEQFMRPV